MHLLIKVFSVKIMEYFSITRPLCKTILSFNFFRKKIIVISIHWLIIYMKGPLYIYEHLHIIFDAFTYMYQVINNCFIH